MIRNTILARWSEPDHVVGTRPETLDTITATSGVLASASDGQRILLVWDANGTIRGRFVTRDDFGSSFEIARGNLARQRPTVAALGKGRFLVGYEIVEAGTQRRLGGRAIDVNPPPSRKRAIR